MSTLAHHLWTPPIPPAVHVPTLDPRLEQIVLRAMRKNPDERFQSMQDVVDALDKVEQGGATLVDPLPPDVPYAPGTSIGALVKASLGRAIGLEGEPPARR